ncbi:hypothetical protein Agub_g2696, partial [Astrephomene gubernaculifera]
FFSHISTDTMRAALAFQSCPRQIHKTTICKPGSLAVSAYLRNNVKVRAKLTHDETHRDQQRDVDIVPSERSSGVALEKVLRTAQDAWAQLDPPQRVYTVIAAVATAALLPQLLALALIPLERLVVGGLLAVEEVFALALLQSAKLALLVGLMTLLAWGVYVFLFRPGEQR